MFEVSVDETFAAGHALRGYKGKCENVHGHNYRVRVTLQGDSLDQIGLLYDFVHLKQMMKDVIQVLDHRFMNEIPPFDTVNPSAENIAKYFYQQAAQKLPQAASGARLASVTVWESDTTYATYRE
jgi:6-pyruvoyltetrahydropterin/6-carboxytetrahydropterin synthase